MGHRKPLITLYLVMALAAAPFSALASASITGDKGTDMALDLIVTRPAGVVATVVGATLFVLALPFTLPNGSVGESACELVRRPAAYTFTRPLGDLEGCGSGDCTPCATSP